MRAEKRTAAEKKKAKPQERKYFVRLKRGGQHGEEGLGRYYFGKKLYKRDGIYRVDQKTRVRMRATGKFEDIMPEDLETAKAEAKSGRGITIQARARLKRREAQRNRRSRFAAQVDENDDGVDEYELEDEDVDPDLQDEEDPDEEQLAV